jgi:hypothetical protein
VSRKSVPFSVPEGAARPSGDRRRTPEVINAHSDEWVSDRNSGVNDAPRPGRNLVLDLAAERSLTEVVALSMLAPITLGWVWLLHAMHGRARL